MINEKYYTFVLPGELILLGLCLVFCDFAIQLKKYLYAHKFFIFIVILIVVMVLKAKSKLYKHPKGNTMYLTFPSDITTDSQFPFNREGAKVTVTILKDQIIITKGGE